MPDFLRCRSRCAGTVEGIQTVQMGDKGADKKTNAEFLPWPYGHSIRSFPSSLLHKSFQLIFLLHTLIAAFLVSGCFPLLVASLKYEIVIL